MFFSIHKLPSNLLGNNDYQSASSPNDFIGDLDCAQGRFKIKRAGVTKILRLKIFVMPERPSVLDSVQRHFYAYPKDSLSFACMSEGLFELRIGHPL